MTSATRTRKRRGQRRRARLLKISWQVAASMLFYLARVRANQLQSVKRAMKKQARTLKTLSL